MAVLEPPEEAPKPAPPPKYPATPPFKGETYLLAPSPWPRGEFRIDPENA